MQPTAIVVNHDFEETEALKKALLEADISLVGEFNHETAALEWIEEQRVTITLVVASDPSPHFASQLRLLPATRYAHVQGVGAPPLRPQQMPPMTGWVDSILVKPFPTAVFEERLSHSIKTRARKRPVALLLDEAGDSRQAFVRSLAKNGVMTIYEATDAEAGIELLKSRSDEISVVVASGEMPSKSVDKLFMELHGNPRWARLPFFLLTSGASLQWLREEAVLARNVSGWWSRPLLLDETTKKKLLDVVDYRAGVDAYLAEARIFRSRGVPGHATAILSHAVAMYPEASEIFGALAEAHAQCFERPDYLQRAAEAYEKAHRLKPADRDLAQGAAEMHLRLNAFQEAARVCRTYLQHNPLDEEMRLWLVRAHVQLGDAGAAQVEYRRVLSINPSPADPASVITRRA